jgi:hypothetical protein
MMPMAMLSILIPEITDPAMTSASRFMDQRKKKPNMQPPRSEKNSSILPFHLQPSCTQADAAGDAGASFAAAKNAKKHVDFAPLLC